MIVKAESYYTQRYTQFEECTRQGSLTHSLRFAQRTALRRHWRLIHYCPRSSGPSCGLGQGTALGLHWSPIHYRARFDSPAK